MLYETFVAALMQEFPFIFDDFNIRPFDNHHVLNTLKIMKKVGFREIHIDEHVDETLDDLFEYMIKNRDMYSLWIL